MKGYPKLRIRLAVGVSLLGASLAFGAEYTLGPGETDSITEGTVEYDSATIAGDLSVSGGAYFSVNDFMFNGGSVSATGGTVGRSYVNKGYEGTVTIGQDTNGAYTSFSASEDGLIRFHHVTVAAPTEPLESDTVLTLATVDSATLKLYSIANNTSCTNRFLFRKSGSENPSFGGNTGIERVIRGGSCFSGAPFVLEAEEGVDRMVFAMGGGVGRNYYFNATDTDVLVKGNCDLEIDYMMGSDSPDYYYKVAGLRFRTGTRFDINGDLYLGRGTGGNYVGTFYVEGDVALGPNVGTLKAGMTAHKENRTRLTVSADATLTVNNFDFSNAGSLAGAGTIQIDAAAAARTFKGGTVVEDSTLVVRKIGANAATVSGFAWLPSVDVREGDLVFASDTVISNTVTIAEGARLVADGCTVTLFLTAENSADLLARCAQVNGGRVVLNAANRAMAYVKSTATLPAALDIVGGNVIYSGLGIDRKFWRFTYTKMADPTYSLALGRFWMFDVDGERACKGLATSSSASGVVVNENTKPDASDMSADGYARFRVDSRATVRAATEADGYKYAGFTRLSHVFKADFRKNTNNAPIFMEPALDPEDSSTWVTLELRLAASAKPITGYNFATAASAVRYPTAWTVFASDDGKNWEMVEQRADVSHAGTIYTFYGETTRYDSADYVQPPEAFHFTNYRSDNLTPSANPLAVRLDKGATLDLRAFVPAGGQEVNALTVDVAQEVAGVLYGAKLSQTGNVNVIAPTRAAAKGQLPIRLVDLVGDQRLDGWTVSVNGVPTQKTLRLEDDGTVSVDSQGLILLFR